MSDYRLTHAADKDIEEIWRRISTDSGNARADAFEESLHEAMQRLGDAPQIGHLRADLGDEHLRVWPVAKTLIIYRPEPQPIQIIRVLHGARDVGAVMDTRDDAEPGS
ncbi:MAG: type II toxin-antitoxin system RelE/ParE family toxin [Phycisphaerales bacterium]